MRMYTVAAFPSTNSPYLTPSLSARGRLRQAIRSVALLASSLQPHQINHLGPLFAFIVWVAARGLIILWTTGYEQTYGSQPVDLDALTRALRELSSLWPCAQSYADIIQLILDTKNSPGGPISLEIFNDTRRTSYGLKNLLGGRIALNRASTVFPQSFDFLDMPYLDINMNIGTDFGTSRAGGMAFGPENGGDWL